MSTRHYYQVVEQSPAKAAGRIRLISYKTVGELTAILDYLLISSACFAAAYGYHFVILHELAYFPPYFGIANISAIIFLMLSHTLYRPNALLSVRAQMRGILFNWMALLFIVSLALFLLKIGGQISRGALTIFGILGLTLLLGSRRIICRKLREALASGNLAGYQAILMGDSASLAHLSPIDVLQRFGANELDRFELPDGHQLLTTVDEAIEAARLCSAEWVLLAINWSNQNLRKLVCERLEALPLPVFLLPDDNIRAILGQSAQQIGYELSFEVQRAPLSAAELMLKRVVDLLIGGATLVLLAPLLALVAVAIKLDSPGPVIFRQRRKGFNGRKFNIYKFRTMNVLQDGAVIQQAERNDVRVTRLGKVLRASSIDELPQLINVLRGQMSLVGPRPHAVAHDDGYAKLISKYALRQHVKPGLTGWAQVKGLRGETPRLELMEQRVARDLWYIKNWSIWLDFRIMGRTLLELMLARNAY